MNRSQLVRDAANKAARLRAQLGLRLNQPVCPFDVARALNIRVRLLAVSTLEGVYSPGSPPEVILGSLRPAGRRRFSCAHELGHNAFGHATSAFVDGKCDRAEEFLAESFAGWLLMPKLVVENAFARRSWRVPSASAAQVFTISQDLGVGFTTLIDHMTLVLRTMGASQAGTLKKMPLQKLRKHIAGEAVPHDIFPVDAAWGSRPLDVEVDDWVSFPTGTTLDGRGLRSRSGSVFVAEAPGEYSARIPSRSEPLTIRVCRREFEGLAQYRYLEDCDE